LETGDATEVESICEAADSIDGPVYCRVLRGSVPRLFDTPIEVGKMRELESGNDILIVSSGITTEEAMRASAALKGAGVSVRHLHLNTIKPFDHKTMLDHIASVKGGVITLENHVVDGGIGSLLAETMADNGVGKRLIRLGLKDTYAHGGSRAYLMRYYGLDALALVHGIEDLMGQKFGITENDLSTARVDAVHSLVKAEGL
jgi:transketolase